MKALSFILGIAVGAGGWGLWSLAAQSNIDTRFLVAEDYIENEDAILATENDILRFLASDLMQDQSEDEVKATLLRLGLTITEDTNDDQFVATLADRKGSVIFHTRDDQIWLLSTSCTLQFADCPKPKVTD
ncbi:MAG: hypothetical protein VX083_06785 [Pseudomonadota bacterium]|jgi:hypothetical protein|nr:hypothetical protein [Pseudomonadota bacterium]MEC8293183.1 hypothetical protein [Pseudomonadota bacterium]